MYTIGRAAVKYLADHIAAPVTVVNALRDTKLVAYVGTAIERTGGTAVPSGQNVLPTMKTPEAVFFEVAAPLNSLSMPADITQIDIYFTSTSSINPTGWVLQYSLTYAEIQYFNTLILSNDGFTDALYCIPRGNLADRQYVPVRDGMMYYDKEHGVMSIFDETIGTSGSWIDIFSASSATGTIGQIQIWPELMPDSTIPYGFIRLPSHAGDPNEEVSQSIYGALFNVLQNYFGIAATPGYFVLPKMANAIIRYAM